jgi:beta-galactosidase
LEGSAAVTSRAHGKGRVVYVGTYLTPELAAGLVETVCAPAGAVPLVADLPKGVEVSVRQAADRALWFVQNTTDMAQPVAGLPMGVDLLTGQRVDGRLTLDAHGCAIVRQD